MKSPNNVLQGALRRLEMANIVVAHIEADPKDLQDDDEDDDGAHAIEDVLPPTVHIPSPTSSPDRPALSLLRPHPTVPAVSLPAEVQKPDAEPPMVNTSEQGRVLFIYFN